mmetsp:Transcript_67978/g.175212  ORF Transcript_67978/g.175212 Transcript_67978/m.175212 type:complete len:260 (+) Transcript_67978:244-1023(+)
MRGRLLPLPDHKEQVRGPENNFIGVRVCHHVRQHRIGQCLKVIAHHLAKVKGAATLGEAHDANEHLALRAQLRNGSLIGLPDEVSWTLDLVQPVTLLVPKDQHAEQRHNLRLKECFHGEAVEASHCKQLAGCEEWRHVQRTDVHPAGIAGSSAGMTHVCLPEEEVGGALLEHQGYAVELLHDAMPLTVGLFVTEVLWTVESQTLGAILGHLHGQHSVRIHDLLHHLPAGFPVGRLHCGQLARHRTGDVLGQCNHSTCAA